MNEFFVDLLPDDARRSLRRHQHLRLFKFATALMTTITIGLVTGSFVELRKARAEHDVIVSMRDRASRIDELVAQAVHDRAALHAELGADAMLRSPVTTGEVVATIANLLPEGGWLESLRVSLDETRNAKGTAPLRPAYLVTMSGCLPSAEAVQTLAGSLRKTPPFVGVSVVEQRSAPKAGGGLDQHFVLRLKVNPSTVVADEVANAQRAPSTPSRGVTQ